MSSAERKSGRPEVPEDAPEESFWAAAGGFSEDAADEHASKIFALWELGGDHAALQPAGDAAGGEDDAGAWSAEAPAEAGSDAPTAVASPPTEPEPGQSPAAASAPAESEPEKPPASTPAATEPEPEKPAAVESAAAARPARPAPEPLPPRAADEQVVLPRSGGATKTYVAIGIAAVVLLGVAVFAFSAGETPEPAEPTAAAEPAPEEATEPAPEIAEPEPTPEPAAAEPAAPVIAAAVAEPAEAPVAPAEPPEPTTSALSVRTLPANATLSVDGREVENPFEAELEIGAEVRLSADARGYRRATRTVRVGDEPQAVTLSLERRARRQPRRRPRPERRERAPREQAPPDDEPQGAGFTTANPY